MSKLEVVKYGSDLIADKNGLDRSRIGNHVDRIATKQKLIIVTSGAAVAGRALYESIYGEALARTLDNQKYLAGLGCTTVFHEFEQALRDRNRLTASYPITHHDLENSQQLFAAINANLERNTVTIFNEADAFSQTELIALQTGGDNDGLAAHVAIATSASRLTIVTQNGGIVDDDGVLIERVDASSAEQIMAMLAGRDVSKNGRGGIVAKVAACISAMNSGIEALITDEDYRRTTTFVVG